MMYISFVVDDEFAGACIVLGDTPWEACEESYRQGCNPGGQAVSVPVPSDLEPRAGFTNRLLSKEEVDAAFGDQGLAVGQAILADSILYPYTVYQ